jgi:hypothetical protein
MGRNIMTISNKSGCHRFLTAMLVSAASLSGLGSVFSTVIAAGSAGQIWNFDTGRQGAIAEDFSGEVGRWEIIVDVTAPSKNQVLTQLEENAGSTFNIALVRDTNLQDVDIAV